MNTPREEEEMTDHAQGIGGKDLDTWLTEKLVESRNASRAGEYRMFECPSCGKYCRNICVDGIWRCEKCFPPKTENPDAFIDGIMTNLYRRFKEWSKRGFGPDDVTWCEVKADILVLLAFPPTPVSGGQEPLLPEIKSVLLDYTNLMIAHHDDECTEAVWECPCDQGKQFAKVRALLNKIDEAVSVGGEDGQNK